MDRWTTSQHFVDTRRVEDIRVKVHVERRIYFFHLHEDSIKGTREFIAKVKGI